MLMPKRVKYRKVQRGRMTGDVYKRQVVKLTADSKTIEFFEGMV